EEPERRKVERVARERQSPDWRFAGRQSGDWRSRETVFFKAATAPFDPVAGPTPTLQQSRRAAKSESLPPWPTRRGWQFHPHDTRPDLHKLFRCQSRHRRRSKWLAAPSLPIRESKDSQVQR